MKDLIFVSYFTTDTPYEEEIKGLIESLVKFDLPYDIWERPSQGSWIANCSMISTICREALAKYPNQPVVFFPADVRVMQWPKRFYTMNKEIDFATRYAVFYRGIKPHINTSVLYFAPTDKAKWLVQEWERRCQLDRNKPDQVALQEIIDEDMWGGKWRNLPEVYCRIFDNPTQSEEEPVIVAHQASRRFRKSVNRKGQAQ